MNENFEKQLKAIKALLVVLIVTTAATAGLVAVVMVQWTPVANYYREGIAEEKAYEEEYGDGTDEGYYEEEAPIEGEGEDIVIDDEGNVVEDDVTVDEGVVDDGTGEDAASDGAVQ
jgi:hypothetical protein